MDWKDEVYEYNKPKQCRDCEFIQRLSGMKPCNHCTRQAELKDYYKPRSNKIQYKGYETIMRYSKEDKVYYGKLEGIQDLVSFHSESENDFELAFQKAVDAYLDFCEEIGKQPDNMI